jgi:hypothetical protein
MATRQEQRTKKREIFCTLGIEGMGWIDAPKRPVTKCDTVPVLPPRFYVPEVGTPVADVYAYPEPPLVGNAPLTVNCGTDTPADDGESVSVGLHTYVTPLPWSFAGSLEPWQIKYLNTLSTQDITNYLHDHGHIPADLVEYLRLSYVQATALSAEYVISRTALDLFARAQALSRLDCVFLSKEVTAECPEDILIVQDPCLGSLRFQKQGTPIVLPAGARTSYVSQEEADALAQTDADQALLCTYKNLDAFSLDCCDLDRDNSSSGLVFNLVREDGPVLEFGIGEFVGESETDILNELLVMRRFVLKCRCEVSPSSAGRSGSIGGVLSAPTCAEVQILVDDLEGAEPCNTPVSCSCPPGAVPLTLTIPACAIRDTTVELANQTALEECQDNLLCQYCNDRKTGTCSGGDILITAGIVEAGEVCTDSKEEANSEAQDLADERTICGEPCDRDCFCGTREQAIARLAGTTKELPGGRRLQVEDALLPCGVAPLPWPCTPPDVKARKDLAHQLNTTVAMDVERAMYEACIAKRKEIIARTIVFCGPNEATCWALPETEPTECDSGCECMTELQSKNLVNPQRCNSNPCGVAGELGMGTPMYCFSGDEPDDPPIIPDDPNIIIPDKPKIIIPIIPGGEECPPGCSCQSSIGQFGEAECGGADKVEVCSTVACKSDPAGNEGYFCLKCKPDDDGDGDGSGSGKTAIVASPLSSTGHYAMYTDESPEMRFNDIRQLTLYGRITYYPLEDKLVSVCEPGSILPTFINSEYPESLGLRKQDDMIVITAPDDRVRKVVLGLSGIRRGKWGIRFEEKTEEEFRNNEAFWQRATIDEKYNRLV